MNGWPIAAAPRGWYFAAAVGVALVAVGLVARAGASQARDTERGLDAWAGQELASLLAAGGAYSAARLEAVMLGREEDATMRAWLDAEGAGAELTYHRIEGGGRAQLRVFCRDGHRTLSRDRAWDELPAVVRGAFLRREPAVTLPWHAPWRTKVTP